jgi:uncharacterized protein (DUF433 family)
MMLGIAASMARVMPRTTRKVDTAEMTARAPDRLAHAAEAGCYEAWRAAALSGVPIRTVYHWASTGLVVPSVSAVKEMLWSYADLMILRIVTWLRRKKEIEGAEVPASTMREVRRTLQMLDDERLNLWLDQAADAGASPILVDPRGRLFVETRRGILNSSGQRVLDLPKESLRLLAPFHFDGNHGPDLIRPRPNLRIVPLKVAGEPHVDGSRITSRSLAAMRRRGLSIGAIAEMYEIPESSVDEAVDLEESFARYGLTAA